MLPPRSSVKSDQSGLDLNYYPRCFRQIWALPCHCPVSKRPAPSSAQYRQRSGSGRLCVWRMCRRPCTNRSAHARADRCAADRTCWRSPGIPCIEKRRVRRQTQICGWFRSSGSTHCVSPRTACRIFDSSSYTPRYAGIFMVQFMVPTIHIPATWT